MSRPADTTFAFIRRALGLLFGVVALLAWTVPAGAQQEGSGTAQAGEQPITTAEIESLISTLENESERQAFIENLKALVEAEQKIEEDEGGSASSDIVAAIAGKLALIDQQVDELIQELDDGSAMWDWIAQQAGDAAHREAWLRTGLQIALILFVAIASWIVLALVVRPHLRKLEERAHGGWIERALLAAGRAMLLAVPVAAFAALAYLAMMLIRPDDLARVIAVAVINAVIAVRLVGVLNRSLLSPLAPRLRPLPLGDEEAAYLFVWAGRFAAVGVYGFFSVDLLGALGMPEGSTALLLRIVGLVIAAMALILILQSRDHVAEWIRTHPESGNARIIRQRLADIWHVLASVAVIAIFVVWALDVEGGFTYLARGFGVTGIALFGALLASTALRRLLARIFRLSDDVQQRFPGLDKRANRYVSVVSWVLNVVVWLFAAMVVLQAWGIGVLDLFATPEGAEVVSRALAILVIGAIAIIVWEIGDGMISRTLVAREDNPLSPRLKTLLPLARNALLVAISVIGIITVLAEVGVDIGPLLAGAGVVGLAVGFGAQALVKDIITGSFMLFEDQFSIGDWIDAGGKMGGVESISIRTVRLRDIDGYVHTVPFGEITVLTNMMRDFGYAVIDVGVAYKENTDEVLEVIKQVDAEAREDPDFAERLAGDLEILGVNALGDSAVTLRVRVRTVAGYQWGVRREYLRRIKLRFDEVGIEIPFPHMTVWFGEMKGGKLPPVAHVRLEAETVEPREDEQREEAPPADDTSSTDTPALSPPGEVDRS